jgi:hypothetical protein
VNSLTVFVALLVLSYFAGLLSGHPISRHLGLASGVEYVLLGVVVGPHVLGLFRHDTVVGFEPLLLMVLGWLAAALGIQYARFGEHRLPFAILISGIVIATLTGTLVAASAYWAISKTSTLGRSDAICLALALGAVSSGSAHQAVRWATSGWANSGSLSRVLEELGSADDLPPLLMLAGLGFFSSGEESHFSYPQWLVSLIGLGLGIVLGLTVAALLGQRSHRTELWPVLLGAVLLVVGMTLRLQLPVLTPVFLLGLTLALLSPHREAIRALVHNTERPLLVPALLLVGALVELPKNRAEWLIVGTALASRLVFQFVFGSTMSLGIKGVRGHGVLMGQALLSTGGASLSIALAVYFRHPGEVGRVVLFVAVAATLLGELLGGRALRRIAAMDQALVAANEPIEAKP